MSTEITGVRFVLMSDVVSLNLRIPLLKWVYNFPKYSIPNAPPEIRTLLTGHDSTRFRFFIHLIFHVAIR